MFYLFGRLQVDTNLQLIFGAGRAETPLLVLHINSNLHILPTLEKLGHVNYLYKHRYVY